jgi:hypothetical protein
MVTDSKQKNYMEFCNGIVCPLNPIETINKYTAHETELYATVNLALASDSIVLQDHGEYIRELRSSVLAMPLLDDALLYRGVELSKREVDEMERLKTFFIPSFTSTSVDPNRAYNKTHTLVIKLPYGCKYACSVTPELSRHYNEEREVLLACYSAYTLERIEHVAGKNVVTLYMDEFYSGLNSL